MNRDTAYTALADLVYKGFLTLDLTIDDVNFKFKTINERELELIKLYSGPSDRSMYNYNFNNYFIVFSICDYLLWV